MRAGFSGGLIVDFPNSAKAKKYFLCLSAGPPDPNAAPPLVGLAAHCKFLFLFSLLSKVFVRLRPLHVHVPKYLVEFLNQALDSEEAVKSTKRERPRKRKGREKMGAKAWILKKKERQRRQGKEVRPDSKYSGRKRSKKF